MSFLKSAINQVGRDMGKVVSNQLFKDAHATPYRNTSRKSHLQTTERLSIFTSHFDKAINFQTGHRPSTLIAKISGVYTELKNEANLYVADGYLDTNESDKLFNMMQRFNKKIDDICDLLEIDEVANQKEINQLTKIVEKTNDLFKQTLKISANGCNIRKTELEEQAANIQDLSFGKFVGLNAIWMGNYAKTGKKNMFATVLANILSLLTCFGLAHLSMAFYGMLTFTKENSKRKKLKTTYQRLAELEGKRADTYLSMI